MRLLIRLACLFLALSLVACHENSRPPSATKPSLIFGLQMPDWMVSLRDYYHQSIAKIKAFFASEGPEKTQLERSGQRMKAVLRSDPMTRLLVALYINFGIVFLVYVYMFFRQVELSVQLKRESRVPMIRAVGSMA
ncbi:unnamed protein product, partial [Mesorhabditis spiculigera]